LNLKNNWVKDLVCPYCHQKLKANDKYLICDKCKNHYQLKKYNVPTFVSDNLSEHQKSELNFYINNLYVLKSKYNFYNQIEPKYRWIKKWINNLTINENTKIICIGGSYKDDLPHVKTKYKFNVDHLAHKYQKLFPEIKNANIKYIAANSAFLPFPEEYADIVYSRNSLDHVNNPIKTLLEIHRVLKPTGRFYLSVYYNSFFVESNETTVIDDEFLNKHIRNLFDIEWYRICSPKHEGIGSLPPFTLPNNRKIQWLYAILKKKNPIKKYDNNILKNYEALTSNFHRAVFYDNIFDYNKALKYYKKVMESEPFLKTDKDRILYSKIRFFSLTDQIQFKNFFNDFKIKNKDPYWWKIIIKNSYGILTKKELKRAMKIYLPYKMGNYLIRYMRIKKYKWLTINGLSKNMIDKIIEFFCPKIVFEYYLKLIDFINKILFYKIKKSY